MSKTKEKNTASNAVYKTNLKGRHKQYFLCQPKVHLYQVNHSVLSALAKIRKLEIKEKIFSAMLLSPTNLN